jgi:hypothetical protein
MKKKLIKIICSITIAIAIPLVLDFFVFGNNISSNIDNDVWAGFLGSYIGGIGIKENVCEKAP